MERPLSRDEEFIRKLRDIVLSNLGNEQFGVEELSRAMGMSHTTIHRKLRSCAHLSISQFIREVRLQKAREMLVQDLGTVSEISYRVGFGSPTYFNKCFHEYYGYPPGELKKNEALINNSGTGKPDLLHSGLFQPGGGTTASATEKLSWFSRPRLLVASGILAGVLLAWFLFQTFILDKNTSAKTFSAAEEKSIVVLPFKDFGVDSDNQFLADGVTIDIRDHLSRIKGLKVISGTTSEYFRDSKSTIPEIAKELGVSHALEGSVQTDKNQTRISIKLIDARNDHQVLSETFDRDLDDIFSVQSEIAQDVAARLEATLSAESIERMEKFPTKSPQAHINYLKGIYFLNLRGNENLLRSIEYFEKSIAADPDYAVAYAGLAEANFLIARSIWIPADEAPAAWLMPTEAYRVAEEKARKALDIDPYLAEAHNVIGGIYASRDWQWEKARKEFKEAIKLNPNYSSAYFFYYCLLNQLGENDEARIQLDNALELDPFSRHYNWENVIHYYNKGNFPEALNALNECNEMGFAYSPYDKYFFIYMYMGEDSLAYDSFRKASGRILDDPAIAESLQRMYEQSGALGILDWINNRQENQTEPYQFFNHAKRLAILGKTSESLDFLEKTFDIGFRGMPDIYNSYDFRNLRGEPRFNALLRKMNLPEYKLRKPDQTDSYK